MTQSGVSFGVSWPKNGHLGRVQEPKTAELKGFLIGSRGRTRTFNHTVNSRVLYH